jgi:hypothetical protein
MCWKKIMLYERHVELSRVRNLFKKRLEKQGLSTEQAEQAANLMSHGDIDQVQKDLKRHPSIMVIDEITGKTHRFFPEDFAEKEHAENFLRILAKDDQELYEYLTLYFHQGGFMHLAEMLISYYFAPDIRFNTDNRIAAFTIAKDRSITYEEKFNIQKVSVREDSFEKTSQEPIAEISLKSTIKKAPNNEINHQYKEMDVKVNDKVASKYFADHRKKFQKCISWVKDTAKELFSRKYRAEERARRKIR